MLKCPLDSFLETLSPFSPHSRWIDRAYEHLEAKRLLGTPAETTLPPKSPPTRTTKNSRKAATFAALPGQDVHESDPGNVDTVQWEAYRNMSPACTTTNEMQTFKHLEEIVKALYDCPDPDRNSQRKLNGYRYLDCPGTDMASEIMGAGLKVDAVIYDPDIYKQGSKVIPLAAAQTAVVMEFKKEATLKNVYENRKQLVSAANHILNDDPRRNWMYGITIENTKMSLWYFSRSYSMKSASFSFTKDFRSFIRVFLSFLYATDEELGHDPSIFRKYYKKEWCYIYKLRTAQGSKYYRTEGPLYNSRSHCITGRKSRVWEVIEVTSQDDLTALPGEQKVALKDCWVDEGLLSEKEIQDQIFNKLKNVREAAYEWAPPELKKRIKAGLACPEAYLMKVKWDWKQKANKEKPEDCRPAPDLLSYPVACSIATEDVIASSHTSQATKNPLSMSNPHSPVPVEGQAIPEEQKREYRVKQHYRVVYADLGESLAYATNLADAVRAFEDIFIALTLLFLAGWVHRDVSEGNIILVRNGNGVRAKLNDLEYARDFNQDDRVVSTDPKTGTPYFMPIEIHSGDFLSLKTTAKRSISSRMKSGGDESFAMSHQRVLRYHSVHDLESLWWIMVFIILKRIKGSRPLPSRIFTTDHFPHPDRRKFFTRGSYLETRLRPLVPDLLCKCATHIFLAAYNEQLCHFYVNGRVDDTEDYQGVYESLWEGIEYWMGLTKDIKMELEDPRKRIPTDSQAIRKRARSVGSSGGDHSDSRGSLEGPSDRKKQKGVNGGQATDEEGTAVQGMGGIAREDSNPRIRGTWD
ncbi:hypothetical protein Agabi119p4_4238 [Agaricus bisporus var. burnettii]|uniref:Fungal-type protein kinase domain-containing protein n=1 Tax=Agaricus bisporus var. burnettii TaxID=192524 RepID=A0A8H7KH50_AGABI|nr:hypothetical protein Agabi119p4_4238 [Agaricus bisporus var. burnettii]